jgi:hypothetical protein
VLRSVKVMRNAILHHATVAVNRTNADGRRRANPEQLTAAMSAADMLHSRVRAWLLQHNPNLRTRGLKKAQARRGGGAVLARRAIQQ